MACSNKVLLIIAIILAILGLVLIAMGIAGPFIINDAKNDQIDDQVRLDNTDSDIFKAWKSNLKPDDIKVSFKIYAYNITNLDEVMEGAKPHLDEIGPYVFYEYWDFIDLHLNKSSSEASTYRWEYMIFQPDLSPGLDPFNDVIVTASLPYAGVKANLSPADNWLTNLAFSTLASVEGVRPFHTISPAGLVFGEDSPFLEFVKRFKPDTDPVVKIQSNQTSPEAAREELGAPDVYDMGERDIKDTRQYIKWKGVSDLSIWGSAEANHIKGTDGKCFHPHISRDEDLMVFEDDLNRHATVIYQEDVEVRGIKAYRYVIDPKEILNTTYNPANAAYYMDLPTGVMNVSAANQGAPIFVSKPHFLDGDLDYYLNQVSGLSPPNRTLHDTTLDVEPQTGITLNAAKRLQINLQMGPVMLLAPKLRDVYLPIVWVEESALVDEKSANDLKKNFNTVSDVVLASRIVGYGLGGLLLVAAVVLLVVYMLRRRRQAVYDNYDEARGELITS
eukprot:CAMPEP_0177651490 /NCGR_PEP_ID=MMETSP0447-20121125/12581_1 /TAXON_ID=0 /ORGANISM="Stygamoeba regulata, Strain BSH-02190019" /LENGTH=502 /DNA_ID=CAMNT_0019154585 /DNA_START=43 /DNA_END=1551 /DNA_ORIENTATION=-